MAESVYVAALARRLEEAERLQAHWYKLYSRTVSELHAAWRVVGYNDDHETFEETVTELVGHVDELNNQLKKYEDGWEAREALLKDAQEGRVETERQCQAALDAYEKECRRTTVEYANLQRRYENQRITIKNHEAEIDRLLDVVNQQHLRTAQLLQQIGKAEIILKEADKSCP